MEKQQNPTPIVGVSVIQQHSNSTSPVDHYQSSDDVNISTEVFISSPSSYNGSPPPAEGIAVQPSNSFVSPTSSSYNGGNLTNGITISRSNSFVSPTNYNGGNLTDGIDEEISDKEFFDSLPPGYRFCPTDTDLIVHYLQKKINNDRLPRNQIRHVNIYQHSPEHISELYPPVGDKEWYFFTPRDRKYRNGNRPNRAAGCGYWKATGADKSIKNKNVKVGFRKALVYYKGKPPKGDKTNWIMHEYRVDGSPRPKTSLTDMRLDDFVLCRIYKKTDKTFKTKPHKEDCEVANENGEANGIVDPHAYPSDAEKKCDLDIDREFKELEAGYMQSQFHNGGFRDMPVGMEASLPANPTKYFNGNFHFPPNYAAKPMSFRQSMYAQESAFMPKYLNSLDHKPRGLHENLYGIKDYENYTVASDIIIPDFDFAIPIENDTPGFDNIFINYPCNSFETSNNSPDTPKRVDPILSPTQKSSSS